MNRRNFLAIPAIPALMGVSAAAQPERDDVYVPSTPEVYAIRIPERRDFDEKKFMSFPWGNLRVSVAVNSYDVTVIVNGIYTYSGFWIVKTGEDVVVLDNQIFHMLFTPKKKNPRKPETTTA